MIEIPDYRCPSWNQLYAGKHWGRRQEFVEDAQMRVRVALSQMEGGFETFKKPVSITIATYSTQPIDPDNICAKLLIDGLKVVGVIEDDTYKHVKEVWLQSHKDTKNHVLIIIT